MATYRRVISFMKRTDDEIDWEALLEGVHQMDDDVFAARFEMEVALHGLGFARWIIARRVEDVHEAFTRGDPEVSHRRADGWEEYRLEQVVDEDSFHDTSPLFKAMELIECAIPGPPVGEGGFACRQFWEELDAPDVEIDTGEFGPGL